MRLNHPFRPGVSKSVPDDIAEKWFENGWTEVKDDKPTPAKKTASKPPSKK